MMAFTSRKELTKRIDSLTKDATSLSPKIEAAVPVLEREVSKAVVAMRDAFLDIAEIKSIAQFTPDMKKKITALHDIASASLKISESQARDGLKHIVLARSIEAQVAEMQSSEGLLLPEDQPAYARLRDAIRSFRYMATMERLARRMEEAKARLAILKANLDSLKRGIIPPAAAPAPEAKGNVPAAAPAGYSTSAALSRLRMPPAPMGAAAGAGGKENPGIPPAAASSPAARTCGMPMPPSGPNTRLSAAELLRLRALSAARAEAPPPRVPAYNPDAEAKEGGVATVTAERLQKRMEDLSRQAERIRVESGQAFLRHKTKLSVCDRAIGTLVRDKQLPSIQEVTSVLDEFKDIRMLILPKDIAYQPVMSEMKILLADLERAIRNGDVSVASIGQEYLRLVGTLESDMLDYEAGILREERLDERYEGMSRNLSVILKAVSVPAPLSSEKRGAAERVVHYYLTQCFSVMAELPPPLQLESADAAMKIHDDTLELKGALPVLLKRFGVTPFSMAAGIGERYAADRERVAAGAKAPFEHLRKRMADLSRQAEESAIEAKQALSQFAAQISKAQQTLGTLIGIKNDRRPSVEDVTSSLNELKKLNNKNTPTRDHACEPLVAEMKLLLIDVESAIGKGEVPVEVGQEYLRLVRSVESNMATHGTMHLAEVKADAYYIEMAKYLAEMLQVVSVQGELSDEQRDADERVMKHALLHCHKLISELRLFGEKDSPFRLSIDSAFDWGKFDRVARMLEGQVPLLLQRYRGGSSSLRRGAGAAAGAVDALSLRAAASTPTHFKPAQQLVVPPGGIAVVNRPGCA